jgi:DNA-binding NtrC family response regulator
MSDDVRKPLLYIVDDDVRLAQAIAGALAKLDYDTVTFPDGLSGVAAVRQKQPDAVLLDLMLPDIDGIEVLRRIREFAADLPVVMLSGQADFPHVVEAMRLGAYDFLKKPVEPDRLKVTIRNAIERGQLQQQVSWMRGELADRYQMVGDSSALQKVRDLIGRAAPTCASVLVTGETGVGKELVARAIHTQSRRVTGPFVALNCAAVHKDLIESELFGHEKGAFTGAGAARKGKLQEADGGTLLLDEIGDMSLATQAKLLRFLENSEIQRLGGNETLALDVRIVAATNKDLPATVGKGEFREDLYHRLNVVNIRVPPLRERREDVEPLALLFLERYCRRHNRLLQLAPGCPDILRAYDWPGNVRELRNLVERVVVLAQTNPVEPDELSTFLVAPVTVPPSDGTLKAAQDRAEREAVEKALAKAEGNITAAARILGIERPSLHRIMRRLGITAE